MPMPTPRQGEEKNNFIGRCVKFNRDEGMEQDQAIAACFSQWKKSKQSLELKELNYNIPIVEFSINPLNQEFVIEGIAINAVTTNNGHKFLAEELEKSANTLNGVPLLKDHKNEIDAIVGRVKESRFDISNSNIPFKAIVNDEKSRKLIERGDLKSVSVGAIVSEIEEIDEELIPRGIIFKELSLVAVPADAGATFQIALKELYEQMEKCPECGKMIPKEKMKSHMEKEHPEEKEEKLEYSHRESNIQLKGGQKMEEVSNQELNDLKSKFEAQSKVLSEILEKLNKPEKEEIKEADLDEQKELEKKKPKVKEKKEVEEMEEIEEADEVNEKGYKIIQSGGRYGNLNYTLVRKW